MSGVAPLTNIRSRRTLPYAQLVSGHKRTSVAGGPVQQVRPVPVLLRADRVQRAPGCGLERSRQHADESFGARQLHQTSQGAFLVRDRHVDQMPAIGTAPVAQ